MATTPSCVSTASPTSGKPLSSKARQSHNGRVIARSHFRRTVDDVPTFVLRVWLPDRPGALGAVASRIGAVRGDLVGIDILETGGGRAIDELAVELPEERLVPLLVQEVGQVDGVDVEEVRSIDGPLPDPRLDALETAAVLVQQTRVVDLFEVLTVEAQRDFAADWAAVVTLEDGNVVVSTGEPPEPVWLAAFLAGSASSTTATS